MHLRQQNTLASVADQIISLCAAALTYEVHRRTTMALRFLARAVATAVVCGSGSGNRAVWRHMPATLSDSWHTRAKNSLVGPLPVPTSLANAPVSTTGARGSLLIT